MSLGSSMLTGTAGFPSLSWLSDRTGMARFLRPPLPPRTLCRFCILAMVNNAAVNEECRDVFGTAIAFPLHACPDVKFLGHRGVLIFRNVLRALPVALHRGLIDSHSPTVHRASGPHIPASACYLLSFRWSGLFFERRVRLTR